jgi:hypothetical protein
MSVGSNGPRRKGIFRLTLKEASQTIHGSYPPLLAGGPGGFAARLAFGMLWQLARTRLLPGRPCRSFAAARSSRRPARFISAALAHRADLSVPRLLGRYLLNLRAFHLTHLLNYLVPILSRKRDRQCDGDVAGSADACPSSAMPSARFRGAARRRPEYRLARP